MTTTPPQPSPDILALVRACAQHINGNPGAGLTRAFAPPDRASHASEPTNEQLESVYTTASGLCDEGNFQFAAALALHLFTYKPGDPRFGFMAGTCMQRLGMHANAAKFFCHALVTGGDHPASLFRLGECLLALGDTENADRAFDAALDVSRGEDYSTELQNASRELMASVQKK